jgi:hypothetical protein
LVTHYGALWLTTYHNPLKEERQIITAVLATLPAQLGLMHADIFVDIAVVVIVATAIMATVGSMLIARQKPKDYPAV